MNVEISGRHVQITDAVEEYARGKAQKVSKYLRKGVRVEVILTREHDQYQAEMIVSGHRGPVVVSHVQHEELNAAIDLAIDKLEQQLRRLKDRRKTHQGQSMAGEDLPGAAAGAGPAGGEGDGADTDDVSYEDVIDEELNK